MAVETATPEQQQATASVRRRAVRGGTIFLAARLGAQLFQWGVTFFVARLLLPDDYGMMTSGILFVGLADALAEAGVGRALVQRKHVGPDELAQTFTLSLTLAVALYALLFAIAPFAAGVLERPEFTLFLRVLALMLFLSPIRSVAGAILERDLRLGKQSAVHLATAFVQAAFVLGLALAGQGYWALAIGTLVGRVLETGFLWYATGWVPRLTKPRREAWELLRYGLHISLTGLLWFFYMNADFAVLGGLLGPAELGLYALAFQLVTLPLQKLTGNVNHVMFAVFCKLQHDPERVRRWYLRLTVLMTFVAMPALIGLALVADDAIPLLLGERWRPAVLPLRLLCPVGVLMIISSALVQTLAALGRPDLTMKFNAVCAVLYPAGFALAGWWYGVVGVCVVWLVLNPILVAAIVHLTRHHTGITVGAVVRAQLPVLAGTLFMAACVATSLWLLPSEEAAVRLVVGITVGAAAYAGWMLATTRATVLADIRSLWHELRGRRSADVAAK